MILLKSTLYYIHLYYSIPINRLFQFDTTTTEDWILRNSGQREHAIKWWNIESNEFILKNLHAIFKSFLEKEEDENGGHCYQSNTMKE